MVKEHLSIAAVVAACADGDPENLALLSMKVGGAKLESATLPGYRRSVCVWGYIDGSGNIVLRDDHDNQFVRTLCATEMQLLKHRIDYEISTRMSYNPFTPVISEIRGRFFPDHDFVLRYRKWLTDMNNHKWQETDKYKQQRSIHVEHKSMNRSFRI